MDFFLGVQLHFTIDQKNLMLLINIKRFVQQKLILVQEKFL